MEEGIDDQPAAPNPPESGTTGARLCKSINSCLQACVSGPDSGLTTDDRADIYDEPRPGSRRHMPHTLVSAVTYNCEGVMSALPYVRELSLSHDIVFLAETWLSHAEERYLPSYLNVSCSLNCIVVQEFAMDFPPGAGAGRRHGGVAMVCRNRPGFFYDRVQCDDERLCGVTIRDQTGPRLTVLGCYMPYWDSTTSSLDEFSHLVSKLSSIVTALTTAAPILLVGDLNCALPRMSPDQRPAHWQELRGFSKCSAVMQEFLDEHDLVVAEFLFPQPVSFTYERGQCRTHIDHIAVSSCLLESLTSCDIVPPSADNLSPHLPVSVKMNLVLYASVQPTTADTLIASVKRPDILKWDCDSQNEVYRATLELCLSDIIPPDREQPDINELDAC